ncbi:MAG: flagellar export chaperone FliS [Desulfuromonas sp.]|uniref:flagellar export chaperone FliS n=1 Tax=Desulfuromonas sp. TaxID=892 RepID=UPI000CBFE207|nr:flagellar export chaperone FliS [Desulfuromonas sp.]PLX84341.1 MAG: flagellar export chaperone FliS [Desulfuromonas sp.]
MNAFLNQYQNNQVSTASPERILIMLYDGAIRFANRAKESLAAGDMEGKVDGINRTIAIVTELSTTLDHKVGGQIAAELDALYGFMVRELSRANLKNDSKALESVDGLLRHLRETWVQAIEVVQQDRNNGVAGQRRQGESAAAAI